MRKVSKSMWLRRVGPLSLAGALVLPLALEGAEQSKPAVSSEQQEYFESSKTAKQKFFDDIEESRRNAMLQAGEGGAENYKKAIAQLESLVKKLLVTTIIRQLQNFSTRYDKSAGRKNLRLTDWTRWCTMGTNVHRRKTV